MTTVAFCERDAYCQKVLAKHWPGVPIFDDVTTLKGADVGAVDLITGGYPCQPFSVAGKRRGEADERYLWPEFLRLVRELRPSWVVGENVAGHVTKGLDTVCNDLEGEGYAVQAFVFPASAVGANHQRERCFVVAHAVQLQRNGCDIYGKHTVSDEAQGARTVQLGGSGCSAHVADSESKGRSPGGIEFRHTPDGSVGNMRPANRCEDVADTSNERQPRPGQPLNACNTEACSSREATDAVYGGIGHQWSVEPDVGRVAHGVRNRVDRLRALGNAVVPQQAYPIFAAIAEVSR